jgi:anti-sigma-K factor RskA
VDAETHELIAGYALDALDADDEARVRELLATSEEAREELRALTEATAAMATATSGPTPRPELRGRILDAARAEPQTVVSLEGYRRSRAVTALAATAALAAVAALALGIWGAGASRDLDDARAALDRQHAIAAVLSDPDAQSVELQEGDGRLVVDGEGDAVLVVNGLGPAPGGKTYELWVSEHGEDPVPAGLFDGGADRDVVRVDEAVNPGAVVLVTVEPAGGVDAPTSEPIVASQPV